MADNKPIEGSELADATAFLSRYSAQGWIERSLRELALAEQAFAERQPATAAAAMKRAAGMALNGALRAVPRADWGRSYVDHLKAIAVDDSLPKAVSEAANSILQFAPQPGTFVLLRSPRRDDQLLEATRTVMAHAYAVVNGHAGRNLPQSPR
jgi:hypothetical protein